MCVVTFTHTIFFQCVVKEVDKSWSGTLSLGVTSISPRHACLVDKAQELKKRSYVLCTEHKVTCLYIGGKVCYIVSVCVCVGGGGCHPWPSMKPQAT